MYGTTSWGVAFNVNDDLSVSYGEARSIKVTQNEMSNPKRRMSGDSFQVAYTLGGVALKYADTSWGGAKYTEGNSVSSKLVIMSMAF